MVTLVLVKNPFSPQDGREIRHIEAGGTLADLLAENRIEGVDLQATVNGYSVDENTVIKDEDFVVIYPVIEKAERVASPSSASWRPSHCQWCPSVLPAVAGLPD